MEQRLWVLCLVLQVPGTGTSKEKVHPNFCNSSSLRSSLASAAGNRQERLVRLGIDLHIMGPDPIRLKPGKICQALPHFANISGAALAHDPLSQSSLLRGRQKGELAQKLTSPDLHLLQALSLIAMRSNYDNAQGKCPNEVFS